MGHVCIAVLQSAIVDHFWGLLRRRLVCCTCRQQWTQPFYTLPSPLLLCLPPAAGSGGVVDLRDCLQAFDQPQVCEAPVTATLTGLSVLARAGLRSLDLPLLQNRRGKLPVR